MLIPELSEPGSLDNDPNLRRDLLEILLSSDRLGEGSQLFRATRASTSEPWGRPVVVEELQGALDATNPSLSADGLTLRFRSEEQIWRTTRADWDSSWTTPVQETQLRAGLTVVGCPSPSEDSLSIMICGRQRAGASLDLFLASRTTVTGPWSVPMRLDELSLTAGDDVMPFHTLPSRAVYFDSNRSGGAGARDLYVARPEPGGALGAPSRLAELATAASEQDPWVSPDERLMVFASARGGDLDIFMSVR